MLFEFAIETNRIDIVHQKKEKCTLDISTIDSHEVSHLLPVILGENYHRCLQPFKMYHNNILWSLFWIYALLSIAEYGATKISQICYNSSLQGG